MSFKNVFTVNLKRVFTKKMYIGMLVLLLALTVLYKCLPSASKSSAINVGVYIEDTSKNAEALRANIDHISTVYTFYLADSRDALIDDIKSGRAECGYVIPEGFFECYIEGVSGEHNMIIYTVPGTTMSAAINESFFSSIYKMCAVDILNFVVPIPEYTDEIDALFLKYTESDEVFRVSDSTGTKYVSVSDSYEIDLPVFELSVVLIIFAGLLGLLTYMSDSERDIYIALPKSSRILIVTSVIAASILPIYALSVISCAITYGIKAKLLTLSLCMLAAFFVSLLLKPILRKSTVLMKVLPVIMLCVITVVFVNTLL